MSVVTVEVVPAAAIAIYNDAVLSSFAAAFGVVRLIVLPVKIGRPLLVTGLHKRPFPNEVLNVHPSTGHWRGTDRVMSVHYQERISLERLAKHWTLERDTTGDQYITRNEGTN